MINNTQMKITITTSDIRVEYEDEYAIITEEAKKRIIEIIHSLPNTQPTALFNIQR